MNDTAKAGELTYVRIFNAPCELVFECLTTAEHLAKFWGPVGVSTPLETIKIDPKPGGVFDSVMVADDGSGSFWMHAVFVEVVPPHKLVWTEPDVEGGMTTSMTLTDVGGNRTEVVVHQTNVPEMYRTPEAQAGMQSSFDKFAAYVSSL